MPDLPLYLHQVPHRNLPQYYNGASAKQIIDQHVILEIKVLLQSTELSMQEIADRLGFPDQSYLGRYFKRYEGMSPGDYRKTAGT